jgi:immune inhibitor A
MELELKNQLSTSCPVPPSPQLLERIRQRESMKFLPVAALAAEPPLYIPWEAEPIIGRDDGVKRPADTRLAFLAPSAPAPAAAGPKTLNVLVVLVQFPNQPIARPAAHFKDLFFSTGRTIPTGSVNEYYHEVSRALVSLSGDVIGPYTLSQPASYYANAASGRGMSAPNMQTMAEEAVGLVAPRAYRSYDNDNDGFVDAFIIVHAGQGAEVTGSPNDLWSLKWTLSTGPQAGSDGTKVWGFLTVPEDSTIGVCAHELGHLLFGLPDLYDISGASSGIGDWCLMSGGAWNGTNGDTPAHLSAWCKAKLGWAPINPIGVGASNVSFAAMEGLGAITRLNVSGSEYVLVENRQVTLFDSALPGEGLLIFHVDDSRTDNAAPNPKVALIQADNRGDLEAGTNRGDAGDPYPGSTKNYDWDRSSAPAATTYAAGTPTIGVKNITAASPIITADCSS